MENESKGILIYAELTREGELVPVVLELANAAQDLANCWGKTTTTKRRIFV